MENYLVFPALLGYARKLGITCRLLATRPLSTSAGKTKNFDEADYREYTESRITKIHTSPKQKYTAMPYLQIDTSELESRVGASPAVAASDSADRPDRTFGRMRLRTSPRAARGTLQSFNGNVTTAMSVSPLVATVLGVLGVAVLGVGIVAALPNGGASASEPVNTSNLQTAVETLREENATLLEENRALKQEKREAQRGESPEVTPTQEADLETSATEAAEDETSENTSNFLEEAQEAGTNVLLR